MPQFESYPRWAHNNNLSRRPSSLKTGSKCLAIIGLVSWTYFLAVGFHHYIELPSSNLILHRNLFTKKDSDLSLHELEVYDTYFCTPTGQLFYLPYVILFSIFQLLLYFGLLVGATTASERLLWLCWTLLFSLLLIRLHRLVLSECPGDLRGILHVVYASVEIWLVLLFITEIKGTTQSSSDCPPTTFQTPVDLQEFSHLNHLETVNNDHCSPAEVTAAASDVPISNYGDSITNSCPPTPDYVHSSTSDLPPAYVDSVSCTHHQQHLSTNVKSSECPPPYSTGLPPTYEDSLITNPPNNLRQ